MPLLGCRYWDPVHRTSDGHSPFAIGTGLSRAGSMTTCLIRSRFHVYVMCTSPSLLWMTAGYENSQGRPTLGPGEIGTEASSSSAASHTLPSREMATFNGDRLRV